MNSAAVRRPDHNPIRYLLTAIALVLVCTPALFSSVEFRSAAQGGPQRIMVPDEPTCVGCKLEVELAVTLRPPSDNPAAGVCEEALVETDGERVFVAPTCEPGLLAVYDIDGNFQEVVGQFGQGPGEFGVVMGVFLSEDGTVHVFDSNRRHTVLSADLQPTLMQQGLPVPFDAIVHSDGSSISQITSRDDASAGYPLHSIDTRGEIVQSFGAETPDYRSDRPGRMFRTIAATDDGWLWSARFSPYELELWHPDQGLARTIARAPEWFKPDLERSTGDKVHDIRLDKEGRLWVVISLKIEDWNPPDRRLPTATDMDRILDTVIEIIDPRSGRLVASTRTDLAFTRWAGEFLYHPRDLANGDIAMELWKPRLLNR